MLADECVWRHGEVLVHLRQVQVINEVDQSLIAQWTIAFTSLLFKVLF